MKATVPILTNMWSFLDFGMNTSGITKVSRVYDPDASKVDIKNFDYRIRNALKLFTNNSRSK